MDKLKLAHEFRKYLLDIPLPVENGYETERTTKGGFSSRIRNENNTNKASQGLLSQRNNNHDTPLKKARLKVIEIENVD